MVEDAIVVFSELKDQFNMVIAYDSTTWGDIISYMHTI